MKGGDEPRPRKRKDTIMKINLLVLFGTCFVIPVAFAQTGPQGQQPKRFGDGVCLPSYLAHYDVNNDGIIDEEERQVMDQARDQIRKKLRTDWDINGDGAICDQEREQAKTRLRDMINECRVTRFWEAESDTDTDEVLSYGEFILLPGMAKKVIDSPDTVDAIFDRMDTDDSEGISLDEFLAAVKECDQARNGAGSGTGGNGDTGGTGGTGGSGGPSGPGGGK
jgi:Ca2+-binding EF-hand superfamily protein